MTDNNQNLCIDCKSQIVHGAKKCNECGAYQNGYKNALIFGAQVAGFLVIIASAISYLINSMPEIRKILFWKDSLIVLSLDNNKVVFSNSGDGDLYIESIEILRPTQDSDSAATITESIAIVIRSGEVLKHNFVYGKDNKDTFKRVTIAGGDSPITDEWVAIANDAISQKICFELSYFDSDNSQYRQMKQHYEWASIAGPMIIPHYGKVHAYSIKKQRVVVVPFEVVGVVYKISTTECDIFHELLKASTSDD